MLSRLLRIVLGFAVFVVGLGWTAGASRAFLEHLLSLGWERADCVVLAVRVEPAEPWFGIPRDGARRVLVDLEHVGTGAVFLGMPPTAGSGAQYDDARIQQEVLRAVPGARVDCWLDPGGGGAYVRPTSPVVVVIEGLGALFGVVLTLSGLLLLWPGLPDRVLAWRTARRR